MKTRRRTIKRQEEKIRCEINLGWFNAAGRVKERRCSLKRHEDDEMMKQLRETEPVRIKPDKHSQDKIESLFSDKPDENNVNFIIYKIYCSLKLDIKICLRSPRYFQVLI